MRSENCQQCFLIGGASLYNQFFDRGLVDTVELTLVDGDHEGDIFVRDFRSGFHETVSTRFDQ
jgi:dihydrofolate reductase